ncbi:MAG TPA: aminotransferase class I/II-fold pyridoxal phosphate-dependent enzyme, partial [Actinomycetota bacterium]|nr:aminotransferase class I/II-fold pyridoxal phosphate-dependent enzyme [Actinomycetota bacterium]
MERMQCLYEHAVEYNLSESGVEPMTLEELLGGPEALRSLLGVEIGYPQSNGSLPLRERIASFYPGADPDSVTVVNGGSEANFIALWTLLERGDRLAFLLPNYMQGWSLGRHFGAGSDAFRLRVRNEGARRRWALDVDGLERAVSRDTRVILVTNPNNPTGSVLTEAEMDAVVRVARRARAWLVADEIYRGAELDGSLTPTFWGRYDKLVVTSGLSKAFALPGLRIGWMVAPPKLIEKLWIHHDYTTLTPGALSQHLAGVALDPSRREEILARTRGILRRNLPVLDEWVRSHGDLFDYIPPSAGAIALLKYDLPVRSGALIDRIREEQSVLLVPGDQVGLGKYMRIGYGSDLEFMLKGLSRVDETLASLAS